MGNGTDPNSAYDVNGNILKMQQMGRKATGSSLIDNLMYSYPTYSNRLARVTDAVSDPNSKLGDFKDGTNTNDDFGYDPGGNLIIDRNKDISSISYNHLNLATEIIITGKGKINYTYDHNGNKLRKVVTDNTVSPARVTTWLYMQNVVYKNDTIQFFTFEEGRARYDATQGTPEATKFDFDYFLKDHLGNVRMVLTEEVQTDSYPSATLEWERRETEQQFYDIKSAQVKLKSDINGANAFSSFETRLYKVHGGIDGQKTGLGMVFKVMHGDVVSIRAESFYNLPGGNAGGPLNIAVNELLTAFTGSGALAGKGLTPAQVSGLPGNNAGLTSLLGTSTPTNTANAHLNRALFDDQFRFVTRSTDPVQGGGGYKNHTKFINTPVSVTKSGFIYLRQQPEQSGSVL